VPRFSGRRFFVPEYSFSKPGSSAIVLAGPQHVAAAIFRLRMVEIASLRLLGAELAMTKSTILCKRETCVVLEELVAPQPFPVWRTASSAAVSPNASLLQPDGLPKTRTALREYEIASRRNFPGQAPIIC